MSKFQRSASSSVVDQFLHVEPDVQPNDDGTDFKEQISAVHACVGNHVCFFLVAGEWMRIVYPFPCLDYSPMSLNMAQYVLDRSSRGPKGFFKRRSLL